MIFWAAAPCDLTDMFYQPTARQIPDDRNFDIHICKNVRSCPFFLPSSNLLLYKNTIPILRDKKISHYTIKYLD